MCSIAKATDCDGFVGDDECFSHHHNWNNDWNHTPILPPISHCCFSTLTCILESCRPFTGYFNTIKTGMKPIVMDTTTLTTFTYAFMLSRMV